jgi:outer membrane protein assembly factor BamB
VSRFISFVPLAIAAFTLSACIGSWFGGDEEKDRLPGKRISVLPLERTIEPNARVAGLPVWLPRPVVNREWPQAGGNTAHAMYHLAVNERIEKAWRASAGSGSDDASRILTPPVVGGGKVFLLDASARVYAFDAVSGERLWRSDVQREDEEDGTIGGGVAYSGGNIFVTTGFGDVLALRGADGEVIWRHSLSGPIRAAPTVADGRVLVITVDNRLHVLDMTNGAVQWSYSGITETASLLGGASPAAAGNIIVAPFSSGELVALRIENGRLLWSDTLTSVRRTDPLSTLAAIRGNPVIDKDLVFAISNSDQFVAIDLRTGQRLWEQPVGGVQNPWTAGDFVYVLTNRNELLCVTRREGEIRWILPLPRFEDEEDREDPIQWSGPVLVGDRLIVVGSNSEALSISPYTGFLLGRQELPDPVSVPPVVAGGTLYLLTDDADLVAFR